MERNSRKKILLISHDAIGRSVSGPAIRYMQMASHLSETFEVTLAAPAGSDFSVLPQRCATHAYDGADPDTVLPIAATADAVVCLPDTAIKTERLANLGNCLIIDAYDPVLAEWLEHSQHHFSRDMRGQQQRIYEQRLAQFRSVYTMGDAYLCSSERQRDWLLGALETSGRLNPLNYQRDPAFRKLVMCVPMGVPHVDLAHGPKFEWASAGPFSADDKVVIWSGGLWPWLDATPLIHAMRIVAQQAPEIKLFFPGSLDPANEARDLNSGVTEVRALAEKLGLANTSIVFGKWVPYDQWHALLAACALSVTLPSSDTIEGYLAFRTRMLDCVAANLPMVHYGDDVTARIIENAGVGERLVNMDPDLIASSIVKWAHLPRAPLQTGFDRLKRQYAWPETLRPLIDFCQNPRRLPDRDAQQAVRLTQTGFTTSQEQRIAQLEDLVSRYEQGRLMRMLKSVHQLTRWRTHRQGPPSPVKEQARYEALLTRVGPDATTLETQRVLSGQSQVPTTFEILVYVEKENLPHVKHLVQTLEQQTHAHWHLTLVTEPEAARAIQHDWASGAAAAKVGIVALRPQSTPDQALNHEVAQASANFVCVGRAFHRLRPDALFEHAQVIEAQPLVDLIYSDEDKQSPEGRFQAPYFKPDWSPDFLLSQPYVGEFVTVRRESFVAAGGFVRCPDSIGMWDLLLRLGEAAKQVRHIPKVLFATAASHENGPASDILHKRDIIQDALKRRGEHAEVEDLPQQRGRFLVRWHNKTTHKTSIVICTRDKSRLLSTCLESIFEKTQDSEFEVIVVDNNSREPATQRLFDKWLAREPKRFRVSPQPVPFNYSLLNNHGVSLATGDMVLLLNNDTKVITPGWIADMSAHAERPDVGAVGALLLYHNNTIQHAGVIARIGPWCGHGHRLFPANSAGYHGRLLAVSEYAAVTGACMMVRTELYRSLGGMNENLVVTCNDTEFCWRMHASGLRNLFLPYVRLYHFESASRGYSSSAEEKERDRREMNIARALWPKLWAADPHYNINLTHSGTDFSLPD